MQYFTFMVLLVKLICIYLISGYLVFNEIMEKFSVSLPPTFGALITHTLTTPPGRIRLYKANEATV